MNKFRLPSAKFDKSGFCNVLLRNIEDYKRLGYDVKDLYKIYQRMCGGGEE